jgi:hypothetical protein
MLLRLRFHRPIPNCEFGIGINPPPPASLYTPIAIAVDDA